MASGEKFLTVADAAVALQVSVFTMRRYLRAGKLHAVKLGKAWRVPERELQRLANPSQWSSDASTLPEETS